MTSMLEQLRQAAEAVRQPAPENAAPAGGESSQTQEARLKALAERLREAFEQPPAAPRQ
ncbi:MAG: hypothetical protein WCY08_00880 [Rhodocyclaceae bacterium]